MGVQTAVLIFYFLAFVSKMFQLNVLENIHQQKNFLTD